ncbi:hypothetical protein RR46_07121 [Papilio xuthus]|uniref:Mutant cadherin n=1 Tax=Papilio xuthus TaxID=66420 RepID=A0A194QAT0_PAPXU|nr:hypothetical protein RR46_07121 [Papilio xuthus]
MSEPVRSVTPTVLKCASCNIVINELLSFIQNKCDIMDEEGIIRLCVTTFKPEDISSAKNLLFGSMKPIKRKTARKGDGKSRRELEDIISTFKEVDPEELPMFVARDLQKLPPITFDHIDVTRLLKDLLILRNDVETLKNNFVDKITFHKLQNEVSNVKEIVSTNDFECCNYVNTKRGSAKRQESFNSCESGPIGMINMPRESPNKCNNTLEPRCLNLNYSTSASASASQPVLAERGRGIGRNSVPSFTRPCSNAPPPPILSAQTQRVEAVTEVFNTETTVRSSPIANYVNTEKLSMADVVRKKGKRWEDKEKDEGWEVVQRKRYRNRFIGEKGTCIDSEFKFRAADLKAPLFINNVHIDTCERDIIDYIKIKTNIDVTLQKIKAKQQKEYNSYKIFVPKHKLNMFLNRDLWPDGISFRRFVDFRKRDADKEISSN